MRKGPRVRFSTSPLILAVARIRAGHRLATSSAPLVPAPAFESFPTATRKSAECDAFCGFLRVRREGFEPS